MNPLFSEDSPFMPLLEKRKPRRQDIGSQSITACYHLSLEHGNTQPRIGADRRFGYGHVDILTAETIARGRGVHQQAAQGRARILQLCLGPF